MLLTQKSRQPYNSNEWARLNLIWDTICNETKQNRYPSLSVNDVINIRKLVRAIVPFYFDINLKLVSILETHNILHMMRLSQHELMIKGISSKMRKEILNLYNNQPTNVNVFRIKFKPPVHNAYIPIAHISGKTIDLPVKQITDKSLFAFERLAFGNRIKYSLYKNEDFASYFYYNTLYSFQIDEKDLENDNRWQSRLSTLIQTTNYDSGIALAAFYKNKITFKGTNIDTSYVPKYPINEVRKAQNLLKEAIDITIDTCTSRDCNNILSIESDSIFYREQLDVKTTLKIDTRHCGFFRTFPFKDGHWIDYKTCTIQMVSVFYNKDTYHNSLIQDVNLMLFSANRDAMAEECSLEHSLYEVLSYATYCNLEQQAMCLMILRKMVGNYLILNNITIELAFSNETMSRLRKYCANNVCTRFNKTILPSLVTFPIESVFVLQNNKSKILEYVNMIVTIANTCVSSLQCSYICSNYYIPETMYASIFKQLKTPEQLYTFFTLCLQENNKTMYREYRSRLLANAWAGNSEGDFTVENLFQQYPPNCPSPIPFDSRPMSILQNRIDLVRPQDINNMLIPTVPCKINLDKFEFTNVQLNDIVRTGYATLTNEQLVLYTAQLLKPVIKN